MFYFYSNAKLLNKVLELNKYLSKFYAPALLCLSGRSKDTRYLYDLFLVVLNKPGLTVINRIIPTLLFTWSQSLND